MKPLEILMADDKTQAYYRKRLEYALHHCKCLLEAMLPEETPSRQKHVKACLRVIDSVNILTDRSAE